MLISGAPGGDNPYLAMRLHDSTPLSRNAMEEGNGRAELAKPMYDKKMWDDDGAHIQP